MKKPLAMVALAFILGIGAYAVVDERFRSDDATPPIIEAVNRTQEVSLVRLGIQDIEKGTNQDEGGLFGINIPGTRKTLFLQYNFDAKLGLDGAKVTIAKTGEDAYLISVPEFSFIGYDNLKFEAVAEDGGVFSWAASDVDRDKMEQRILGDAREKAYLKKYDDLLKDQTQVFYTSLITSIDPSIKLKFEFAS